eukprot:gene22330-28450_t
MGPLHTDAKGLFDHSSSQDGESTPGSNMDQSTGRFNKSYENSSVQTVQSSTPLNYSGSCQFEVLAQDVVPGVHHLRFALLDRMAAAVDAHHKSTASKQASTARRAAAAASVPAPVIVAGGAGAAPPALAPAAAPAGDAAPRAVVEDSLSIAVMLVPNGLSTNNINSEGVLHITRPPPPATSGSSAGASVSPSPALSSPGSTSRSSPATTSSSSATSFEMVSVVKSSSGSTTSPRKVNPETIASESDVESGAHSVSTNTNRQSTASESEDVDTLLASSANNAYGSNGNKKKKSKADGASQSSAPVCSGVFSFSVPFTQLAAFYADQSATISGSDENSTRSTKSTVSASGVQVSTMSPLQRSQTPDTNNTINSSNSTSESRILHINSLPDPVSVPMIPVDVLVIDPLCNLYASQEIFGLNPVVVTPPVTSPPPASNNVNTNSTATTASANTVGGALSATSVFSTGGRYVEEDCVVCLTDPKEISLLPCRHLCVCTSCLIYIDKCPVCRAAFEEYVVIKSKAPVSLVLPTPPTSSSTATTTLRKRRGSGAVETVGSE